MIRKKGLIDMFLVLLLVLCLTRVRADTEQKEEPANSETKDKRHLGYEHQSHPEGTPCPPIYPKISHQSQIQISQPSYQKSQPYVPKYWTSQQQYIHRPVYQSGWQQQKGWQQQDGWQQNMGWQQQQDIWLKQQKGWQQQQKDWLQTMSWQQQQDEWLQKMGWHRPMAQQWQAPQISQPKVTVHQPMWNYAPMYHQQPSYTSQPKLPDKQVVIVKQECPKPCEPQHQQVKWVQPETKVSYIKVPQQVTGWMPHGIKEHCAK